MLLLVNNINYYLVLLSLFPYSLLRRRYRRSRRLIAAIVVTSGVVVNAILVVYPPLDYSSYRSSWMTSTSPFSSSLRRRSSPLLLLLLLALFSMSSMPHLHRRRHLCRQSTVYRRHFLFLFHYCWHTVIPSTVKSSLSLMNFRIELISPSTPPTPSPHPPSSFFSLVVFVFVIIGDAYRSEEHLLYGI